MLLRKLLLCLFLSAFATAAAGAGLRPAHLSAACKNHKPRKLKSRRVKSRRVRPTAVRCVGCPRDRHGRIRRDPHARRAFVRAHPCPSTGKIRGRCPGWVIDHVVPLKRGGLDHPSNMQWQTIEAAKAKDRIE
jgi:hypothetical protein